MPSAAADHLRRLIADEGGAITVERFMQEALYHPEHGYYARTVQTVGRRGDFSTSATLHPALGQAIAAWLRAHRSGLGKPWHVIELGAGSGELAASVLACLGWVGRRGLRYHIVEVSAGLRAQQQRRLGARARWHDDMPSAIAAADGRALIFSNEFVDAFPCAQYARDAAADAWREVRVAWSEQRGAPERSIPESAADGQRIERHESYRRWLGAWSPQWRAGRMLTIDYGGAPEEIYARRPRGTLRAYWRHQRYEGADVFARFGQQDLTADVNFTDLERWGADARWHSAPLATQADFLRRWLPARTLARRDAGLDFLLDPDGAGGAFKALEQWPAGSAGADADRGVGSSPTP